MQAFFETFNFVDTINYIVAFFVNFQPLEFLRVVLDIGIVSFGIYKVIVMVRDTRAWQLLKGLVFVFVMAYLSEVLNFKTIAYVLNNILSFVGVACVVIFSPELRRALEQIGRSKVTGILHFEDQNDSQIVTKLMLDEVVIAAYDLARTKTGALIVIERKTKVGEYINTGSHIDSVVSASLLENIFVPNTPLHDGAVIIRDNRIIAAACFLPLTDNQNVSLELGTRHRAAIGITDVSDAVSVVVSEETGSISICENGQIKRGLSKEELRERLGDLLLDRQEDFNKKRISKKNGKKNDKERGNENG